MNDEHESQRDVVVFADQFKTLTGFDPMRWQQRLYDEHFAKGALPSSVSVPTGLGKTAVMAIWLGALARQMRSDQVCLPRRLVYVVDRRAVVDQATQFAESLRANLQKSEARELRNTLGLGETEALPISTLRGQFVDNRDWLEDPSRPTIIVGTVDMVGSRLLFEGYGVSRKMRPYHAGLLGADTLVLLDEAHLVPPFEALLASIANEPVVYGARSEEDRRHIPSFKLLPLSATHRSAGGTVFALEEKDFIDPDTKAVSDMVTNERLHAHKHLELQKRGNADLKDALAEQAWARVRDEENELKPVRVIVYCNSRDIAEKTLTALDKKVGKTVAKGRTELLVGARRVRERTIAEQRLKELGFLAGTDGQTAPAFLVATSAGEVGIDLDADHLVCDLVSWERMVQRFGRVNRRGGEMRLANIIVIDEDEPKPKKQGAPTADEQTRIRIYQGVKQLLEKLRDSNVTISVSPESFRQLNELASEDNTLRQLITDASSPAPLRPALNRALVDAWSMTSLREHTGRPEVAPWLRGWVDELPQTTVIWRKYLPVRTKPEVTKKEIEDFFEAAPIHTSEKLETETFRVMEWLQARAGKLDARVKDQVCGILLTVDGNYVQVLHVRDLLGDSKSDKKRREGIEDNLKGKTLIMSASFGGLKKDGLLSHDEKNGWLSPDKDKGQLPATADGDASWMNASTTAPVIRFRIIERDAEPDEGRNDDWLESLRFVLERNSDGEITRWLSIQKWFDTSNTENDRAEGWPQALAEHQRWAAKSAEAIGKRLGLPDDYIAMLAIAARLHDEGKHAKRWQRAFNAERDKRKYGISVDLAKTRGPINQAVLGGYRHEFGSLPYAKDDAEFRKLSEELQDLALHLIAAHHGYARPLIATGGCEDAPPSMLEKRAREAALRFARLQKHWGPWGLAWWEALLRAADVQASRDNDKRGKN